MSLNTTSGARICPECGTRNSALSLFCAECGASLSSAGSMGVDDNGQTTTTFTPRSGDARQQEPEATAATGTHATQEFRPYSSLPGAPGASVGNVATGWEDPRGVGAYARTPPESRRGFALGLLAAILIALVIGFFLWSTVASQDFRDAVTGLFS
jgi:hypothetical protein